MANEIVRARMTIESGFFNRKSIKQTILSLCDMHDVEVEDCLEIKGLLSSIFRFRMVGKESNVKVIEEFLRWVAN
jgi:hypothetical protein